MSSTDASFSSRSAIRLCLRALVVWVCASAAMLPAQRALAEAVLPYFDFVSRLLQSGFVASLHIVEIKGQWMVEATPLLLQAVPLGDQAALRQFIELPPFLVEVNHALGPPVLLIAASTAWPSSGWRELVLRLLLDVAALPLLLALTTPLLMVGQVQMWILELAAQHGARLHEPAPVTAMIFMECGGRWLLPLGLAVVAVALSQRLCFRQSAGLPLQCQT